jgi:hypothetical protein
MKSSRFRFLGVAIVVLAGSAAIGQPPQPPTDPSGDQTSPALLDLIRQHLAGVPNLRPSDGVRIEESKFFRGVIRFRGTIASADQRDALRREIESIRASLERSVDVRISTIDLSGVRLVRESTPKTQPETAGPQAWPGDIGEYPGGVHPSPFAPENPPADSGRKWPWKRGKPKDSQEGAGSPASGRMAYPVQEMPSVPDGANAFSDLNGLNAKPYPPPRGLFKWLHCREKDAHPKSAPPNPCPGGEGD